MSGGQYGSARHAQELRLANAGPAFALHAGLQGVNRGRGRQGRRGAQFLCAGSRVLRDGVRAPRILKLHRLAARSESANKRKTHQRMSRFLRQITQSDVSPSNDHGSHGVREKGQRAGRCEDLPATRNKRDELIANRCTAGKRFTLTGNGLARYDIDTIPLQRPRKRDTERAGVRYGEGVR